MKYFVYVVTALFLTGCMTLDYKVDETNGAVPLKVHTNMKENNIKVIYQGVSDCSNYPGEIMAIMNSKVIGIEGGREVTTKLALNERSIISIQGILPMDVGVSDILFAHQREQVANDYASSLRELYFVFNPKAGFSYELGFNFRNGEVNTEALEISPSGSLKKVMSGYLPETCRNINIRQS